MKITKSCILLFIILCIVFISIFYFCNRKTNYISGHVIKIEKENFVLESDEGDQYQFSYKGKDIKKDHYLKIEFKGDLKENKVNQMKNFEIIKETALLDSFDENGIFSNYYPMAEKKLKELSLDEKISQLLLVRVPENAVNAIQKYQFGGYVLFAKDFSGKTKEEVVNMTNSWQSHSKIPMFLATDEEGGKVVRASSNNRLIDKPFLSSQELYKQGGFDLIKEDTLKKSKFLSSLGLNVNLAPVADVSTDPNDYMYERSFGQDTNLTSKYIETVIKESKKGSVSYVLKHFPGYGSNKDTHTGSATDNRTYDEILKRDIPPFQSGINALAEAILVSHNIITNIEKDVPASLSKKVHNLLRDDLHFNGVIITDDMDMGAISNSSYEDVYVKALEAGNDLIIVTDYETAFKEIKNAVENYTLDEDVIEKAALRVLSWKYYKLMFENK